MSIYDILEKAFMEHASDIHITTNSDVYIRKYGEIEYFIKLENHTEEIKKIIPKTKEKLFLKYGEVDFSIESERRIRARVNVYRRYYGISASIRIIASEIPDIKEIGLPDEIKGCLYLKKGLVLITGITGSGKSTTMASIIDEINKEYKKHIITIEDPVEYIYSNKKSIVTQREIGENTSSFSKALISALRQDPDIIMLGEMRDSDTVKTALSAAETGHLVFSTLHTENAPKSVERIIDMFGGESHGIIKEMIASQLKLIISQRLIKTSDGKRTAVFEVMKNTGAVSSLIREEKYSGIGLYIKTGKKYGMLSFKESLEKLYKNGKISESVYIDESKGGEI